MTDILARAVLLIAGGLAAFALMEVCRLADTYMVADTYKIHRAMNVAIVALVVVVVDLVFIL